MNNKIFATLMMMDILNDTTKTEGLEKLLAERNGIKCKCFITGLKLCDKLAELQTKVDGDTIAVISHLDDSEHALKVMNKISNLADEIIKITEEELKNE